MPFIKNKNIDFIVQDNKIILTDEYKNQKSSSFKKITGSRIFNLLGLNKMMSPFKIWCQMVNIYSEPMDELLAKVGNTIEPKIRKWVEKKTNYNFLVYDPKKIGFDVFKENKIFGGIPDGEPLIDGKINYNNLPMLEIKTTSIDSFQFNKIDHIYKLQYDEQNKPIIKEKNGKLKKWFLDDGKIKIPDEYMFQLGLYCYLRNTNKGLFAIAFLNYEDYLNPDQCDIDKRKIELVEFEIDLNEFSNWIKKSEDWYKKHIITGISPDMNDDDKQFVRDLLG